MSGLDNLTWTAPTPEYRLERLSKAWDLDLWIKRDDLLPGYLGGNKVRKNAQILSQLNLAGSDGITVITHGGANSNHARVVAMMGAQLGWRVHLVLHGQALNDDALTGNQFFMRASMARLDFVDHRDIASALESARVEATNQGQRVVMIPGGGHCKEGAEAYAAAVLELANEYDFIVHASGTGGTQAGIVMGVSRWLTPSTVVGISVARAREVGVESVRSLLPDEYSSTPIHFVDDYVFGGYERHSPVLIDFLRSISRAEGLALDPTYTGKAMYGLWDLARSGRIERRSRVLFWHTGGLLNLQTAR